MATFGSFGDLHPYLAVALALKARGHDPVIATSGFYREKVEALGLGFHAVRPEPPTPETAPEVMRRLMDRWRGSETVFRRFIMPSIRESFADTRAAARGADLLVAHTLAYSIRLVAELDRIPWVSTVLSPLLFFSIHDLPVFLPEPLMRGLRATGRRGAEAFVALMRWQGRRWCEPYDRLRAELGLAPLPNLIFEGQHSPELVLALFSECFGPAQPDWPPPTRITGFPFYDRETANAAMPEELARFLDSGPAPVVFTLGTSAVTVAGDFYEQSVEAACLLGRRAVLLVGRDPRNLPARPLPPEIIAVPYAPYSELFPRAAAIVHQGGVGTTAQAMRSGRPMLVTPYAHDQPDNADRVARLGVARTLSRGRYRARRAAGELASLLEDPAYARNAAAIGEKIRVENGAEAACDAMEAFLERRDARA